MNQIKDDILKGRLKITIPINYTDQCYKKRNIGIENDVFYK